MSSIERMYFQVKGEVAFNYGGRPLLIWDRFITGKLQDSPRGCLINSD